MDSLQNSVLKFLDKLGLDVSVHRITNNNIMIKCPFAKHSHISGTDNKPSFGIKLTGKGFLYNCFTGGCEHKGSSMLEFVEELLEEKIINTDIDDVLQMQNSFKIEFPEYEETYQEKIERDIKLELRKERRTDDPRFIYYNNKRGVSTSTLENLDVQFDRQNKIINFPVFDRNKKLVGFIDHNLKGGHPKYYNRDFDKRNYLYLEWLIKENTVGIIVEGVYDAILTYQHLYNLDLLNQYSVVAMLGTKIPYQQLNKLNKYFDRLILMGDNDVAGIDMENVIWNTLKEKIPLIYKVYYNESDPGNIRDEKKFYSYLSKKVFFKIIA